MAGDDWECQLENESRSSISDDDNVYGVNNLSYLRDQVKNYNADSDETHESSENDEEELNDDDENVLITMSNNGTMSFESNASSNVNSSGNEIESSGDGEENEEDSIENKSGYVPIPNNSDGLVSSQLQRLSQLIRKVNNNQHAGLTPDDLNKYLALQKLLNQKFSNNPNAIPVPHNTLINEDHLKQILELQKKLNELGNTRNTFSTQSTPAQFTVTGNGVYPADATTLHIKATNGVKTKLPDGGYSSSQIVVNRPGGSVVFRLPNSSPQKTTKKKQESQISEDTLKTLLELSKHMTNQAPNTPNFVHSLPSSNGYVQPIIQPVLYNFPWNELGLSSLLAAFQSKKADRFPSDAETDRIQNDDPSMEKISSMSGSVPTTINTPNNPNDPNDTGQTTIVHNHIPITISNPSPTNSIVNRIHSVSTTMRPMETDRYDSYGHKKPDEHTDLSNYYQYPPFPENVKKNSIIQSIPATGSTVLSYTSPFSGPQTSYIDNNEQPQYIQISQSRPDHYMPVYPTNSIVSNSLRPIPTYASVDGGYTQKFYSTYTPNPHLTETAANEIVHIGNRKPYQTMQPGNYIPISTASSPTPSYADPPESYVSVHKRPHISDKVDFFPSEPNEIDRVSHKYENDDYVNSNVEQNNNDNDNENVMSLLANYNSQIKTDSLEGPDDPVQKKPAIKFQVSSHSNHKQFVNLNGNIMSVETYQQSIEPYLQTNSPLTSQIEVLTCATGVRQANSSDCTKYFVCNEKTGRILTYTCPPYTGFNADTKICNAETYSRCFPDMKPQNSGKVSQLSLIEANRIRAEAMKAQQLAHLIRLETDKILNSAHQVKYKQQASNGGKATSHGNPPTRFATPLSPEHKTHRLSQTQRVPSQKQTIKNIKKSTKKPRGKRRVPCKKEGKLVDNLSQHHYFLCFRDQTQTMRARRLQCPAKLLFCPSTLMCTASDRCMNKFNRL